VLVVVDVVEVVDLDVDEVLEVVLVVELLVEVEVDVVEEEVLDVVVDVVVEVVLFVVVVVVVVVDVEDDDEEEVEEEVVLLEEEELVPYVDALKVSWYSFIGVALCVPGLLNSPTAKPTSTVEPTPIDDVGSWGDALFSVNGR